ncbi:MAG TPA: RDD family protein [Mycobacterium sp.]|nr:RDD family protein [Mycobacterium sp.]
MTSGDFQPQPGQYGQPGGQGPGGLGVRFGARLIDGIIVNVVAFIIAFAIGSLNNYWVTGLFSGLLMFLYFLAFESTQGWTPGKKLLGLSVRGPGGAPKPDVQQAAIRNVWTLLNIVPFIGGLLTLVAVIVIAVTINGSPTKQGKHDELAGGTQVVKG